MSLKCVNGFCHFLVIDGGGIFLAFVRTHAGKSVVAEGIFLLVRSPDILRCGHDGFIGRKRIEMREIVIQKSGGGFGIERCPAHDDMRKSGAQERGNQHPWGM
ncbi:MAG: hypothetical protein NPIRA06_28650 [Nitrospirales bacterium]|nr:MAG: hypothetical protein NPIRA06_28650 [Nitrospirales bacterium]